MAGEPTNKQSNTVIGILAHVDAGKTTLSEGILYATGILRKQGRVDHRDTLLDSDELEKARGITIFSSRAEFVHRGRRFTLLDTPGHVDFSPETERTLQVLDAAILLVSGTEGVQAHTRTLWRLLATYDIPVLIFVTKMDYARMSREEIFDGIRRELGDSPADFSLGREERDEQIATSDEESLQEYLSTGQISGEKIRSLVRERTVCPCYFGSGLKLTGITELLDGLCDWVEEPVYGSSFRARVFKITHDSGDNKVAHLKILGGTLRVRDTVKEKSREEKVSRIFRLNGDRELQIQEAFAGDIVGVTGLTEVQSGDELGEELLTSQPVLEPMMLYRLRFPEGTDILSLMPRLERIQEEEPDLRLRYNGALSEVELCLMGEVQAEVLQEILFRKLDIPVEIEKGSVLYKETLSEASEGVGHYEPLRHYAEVHLLLEPLERGSGLQFRTAVSTDVLDRNWQNQVLQHLTEKEHIGVLTGSPVTDLRITLTAGKDHLKHTEGGDFRQATYRAVRQGLMRGKSLLLEPFYRFRLEIPENLLNRAVKDIRQMSGTFLPPCYDREQVVLTGRAPVSEMCDYAAKVAAFTGGRGKLILESDGYDVCHNPEEVIEKRAYRYEKDLENSPDSVFCSHGAGFLVRWDQVPAYMHLPSCMEQERQKKPERSVSDLSRVSYSELEEIMLREFGPIRRKQYTPRRETGASGIPAVEVKPEILLVDGYNVIFAWEELRELAEGDIQAARDRLLEILQNYSAFRNCDTVLVFDGYRVPGNRGEQYDAGGIHVVFTPERESGDLFIERMIGKLSREHRVRVVTSDGMIQLSALRKGVVRSSSREFYLEVADTSEKIGELIRKAAKDSRERLGDTKLLPKILPEGQDRIQKPEEDGENQ